MMPWFIWKDENSYAKGLWIGKLPKETKPRERYSEIDVPGRAGSLIMLQGEDVFESYVKECVILTRTNNALLQEVRNWLRGSGELVFFNDLNRAYDARILEEVSFQRISNDLLQAKVPFLVEPFKKNRYPERDKITVEDTSATILNIGDIASSPVVKVMNTGDTEADFTVTIADQQMTFEGLSGSIYVHCDEHVIIRNDHIWTGTFSGDFWKIPVGESEIEQPSGCKLIIEPNWRWL